MHVERTGYLLSRMATKGTLKMMSQNLVSSLFTFVLFNRLTFPCFLTSQRVAFVMSSPTDKRLTPDYKRTTRGLQANYKGLYTGAYVKLEANNREEEEKNF